MQFTATQLAERVHGEVHGDGSVILKGFAPADRAGPGDLTFAEKASYLEAAERSGASAILVSGEVQPSSKVVIRVADARIAVARLLPLFHPAVEHAAGIHPTAVVDPSAQVDVTAHIGPYCVVGARATIGKRCALLSAVNIGTDCVVGDDTRLHPNVVIYPGCQVGNRVSIHSGTVIGADGYSYVFDEGRHRKMLQVGIVIIHDDVEIGANTAIDRGALGPTVIGQGSKIDNLVHVAHNVQIGKHCLIMGQVGFAGSVQMGDYAVIASQSGVADHLTLGKQSIVGAKSGVMRDVPDGALVLGVPAIPDKLAKRQFIAVQQLPELIRRTRELERQMAALQANLTVEPGAA
jgi:UDP-3-O-[3-hydroxymyristoyl] glucosamine N-acyltransferase